MLPLAPATGMLQLMFALVLGVAAELWLQARLARLLYTNPAFPWLWQELCAPMLRSALMIGGAFFAYPALFGLRSAPSIGSLLPADSARFGTLLALVFLSRFIAPRVLRLGGRPGMFDAMQGLLAVAVLFAWFADYLGAVNVSLWPGIAASLALLGLCMVMPSLAAGLGHDFGARCDLRWATLGLDQLFGKAMSMVAIAPIMTFYGYLLAVQIGI